MTDFPDVLFSLAGLLENPGDTYATEGRLAADGYSVGGRGVSLPDGVFFSVEFTHAGDGILVTGMARAVAESSCDRCLETARFELAGEIDEYLLFEDPEDPAVFEDGFEVLDADRVFNLAPALHDAILTDTPFTVLCRPDCKGLCPVCGANRNLVECTCVSARAVNPDSPFAKLRDLKFD